jgi:dipeptidyl aminopeptidase/acylaminoacyl peptidase
MPFAAGVDPALIQSHGHKLLGAFYTATGATPRPTALLLHGIPGVERNFDLAYALRDAGWNCLVFHYRGSWGSGGTYRLDGLVEDVRAATEWALAQPSVDGDRLAVVGNSLGGYTALAAGAFDQRFKAIAAICPLIDPRTRPLEPALAEGFASLLNGISGPQVAAQWLALPSAISFAPRLAGRPLLLVTAEADEIFAPSHHAPFAAAMGANPAFTTRAVPGADHSFSRQRRELVELCLRWLIDSPNPMRP